MADRPTVVVVGAASRDRDAQDPRGWRLGGGVTYSSLAAVRLGVDVHALVGVDGEAASAPELGVLRAAGIDVMLVPITRGPVFDNRQTPTGRLQVSDGPSDRIPMSALPSDWRAPNAAILGPVAGEIADEWASVFDSSTRVAIGVQGLVRKLPPSGPVQPLPLRRSALVKRADTLLVSAEDVAADTPPLAELLTYNQELVVTHGAAGALHVRGSEARYLPPVPIRDPVDATGAGDVFLGAWTAARLIIGHAETWRPLLVASAMASLSVKARTLAEMPTTSDLCEVLVRLRDRHLG